MRSILPEKLRPAALALVLGALLAVPARAQNEALTTKIDAALARLGPHGITGVRVVSLARKEVLYERNADLSLNPASNMKLITSATALAKLGPDYRFTTHVLAPVRPDASGTVAGDLVLQGGGDPVLETPGLEELADALKRAGVKRVTGSLLADDYRFDAERLGIGWNSDDEPYYYSAQISALTVNRNVLTVDVRPGKTAGSLAEVAVKPLPDYVKVVVVPPTAAAGAETNLDVGRVRGRNELRITGTISVDGKPLLEEPVTMEEPELYAAALFRKLLQDRGISIAGPVRRAPAPPTAVELASRQSVPLSQIVSLLNKPSDNLIAETLLKEIGYHEKHSGSAVAASGVVGDWLKEIGIDTGGLRVNDGSGLSRMDLVTPRILSDLLAYADTQPWKDAYNASLPIAGVDGTLRRRMKETPAEKNVHAKTGSLSHVSALSGYVTTAAGERLVFSIITNNFPGPGSGPTSMKGVEDAIAIALAQ